MRFLVFEGLARRKEMISGLIRDCIEGVQLVECGSLDEAYSALARCRIDIFVVTLRRDSVSGEIPGIRLIELLRGSEQYFDAYIFVISELVDKQLVIYNDYHCYRFYENPIDKQVFVNDIALLAERLRLSLMRSRQRKNDYLFISFDDSFYKVSVANIIFIETHSKYDIVYLRDVGEKKLPKKALRGLIGNLEMNEMLYCNRSEIVNMRNVLQIDKKKGVLTLDGCRRKINITESGRKNIRNYLDYWRVKS